MPVPCRLHSATPVAPDAGRVTYLLESSRITRPLLAAAMRLCDQFNDTEKARQDMWQQVLETQTFLQQNLLDHLRVTPAQPNLITEKTMRK